MEPSNGSQSDLNPVLESGVLEYIQQLKQAGTVRHVGLSSHTPRLVNKVLDMGVIDLVMFSINPGYDYRHGAYAIGSVDERADLRRILGFLDATGGKGRIIAPAAYVIKLLRAHQRKQSDWRLRAGHSGLASALCSQMSWALTCRHTQFSTTTSGSWNPSDCLLHGSTICATPTPWPPSVPAMTSKRCRAASATLRSPLRWTYTATSTSR